LAPILRKRRDSTPLTCIPRNNQMLSRTTTGCILSGCVGCSHEFVIPLLAHLVALPSRLPSQYVRNDVGKVAAKDRIWTLAH